jgi:hypothetical protein
MKKKIKVKYPHGIYIVSSGDFISQFQVVEISDKGMRLLVDTPDGVPTWSQLSVSESIEFIKGHAQQSEELVDIRKVK